MVAKIKNKTAQDITFPTFTLNANGDQVITWDTAFMSGATLGKMIALLELDEVEFYDENDVIIDEVTNTEYYTIDAQGNISATPTVLPVQKVKIELNQQFNQL